MPDREKLIRALTFCCYDIHDGDCHPDCPYYDACSAGSPVPAVMYDVLALLKEQEPRVMTLEEIKLLPDESDVFLEEIDCIVVAATISRQCEKWGARTDVTFFYGIESTSYESDEYYNEDYGRWWRCWTARPTDGQRKAVKWGE